MAQAMVSLEYMKDILDGKKTSYGSYNFYLKPQLTKRLVLYALHAVRVSRTNLFYRGHIIIGLRRLLIGRDGRPVPDAGARTVHGTAQLS
ncbi:JM96 [macacine gammaherpesvirus 11]|uniref:JM96 n=2 Tax=macacine gammaherpesvirus 11 TaxID=2560570 RepID=G9JMA4_9GAMA|nr:JM96 [Macaca fuscata rhadinovirus]AAT00073.1 JM96 [Macaca fuscata rhadinovirus]AEW87621.1 JM96 [Macaca fuscata rhadinovirus]AEW87791.1 JM96 [Macaca fuscata rhadinovirus]